MSKERGMHLRHSPVAACLRLPGRQLSRVQLQRQPSEEKHPSWFVAERGESHLYIRLCHCQGNKTPQFHLQHLAATLIRRPTGLATGRVLVYPATAQRGDNDPRTICE